MRVVGREAQSELLDGDQSARGRLIGTEDRSEHAGTDLMKDSEGSESVRRLGA